MTQPSSSESAAALSGGSSGDAAAGGSGKPPVAAGGGIQDVTIHPLVLLSAADHYHRVARGTRKRVVGALLGQVIRGKVKASNSFAVPFEEDSKNPSVFYLDHNFLENMLAMFRKVNAKERVVGFYSTGPQIRPNDLRIHDIVQRYAPQSASGHDVGGASNNTIFCIIDVRPDRPDLPVTAYKVVEEVSTMTTTSGSGKSGNKSSGSAGGGGAGGGNSSDQQQQQQRTAVHLSFAHVPCQMGALEAEEVGVEHLLRDINDPTVSTVASLIRDKLAGLATLREKLLECKEYLEAVVAGALPPNPDILANVQSILNLLPNLNQPAMVRAMMMQTNDMMMAMYLASLIRSVIAIHDLVNNKIQYHQAIHGGPESNNNKENDKNKTNDATEDSKGEEKKEDDDDKNNNKATTTAADKDKKKDKSSKETK